MNQENSTTTLTHLIPSTCDLSGSAESVSFLEESYESLVKDIIPIAIDNYIEMGTHPNEIPLDPDLNVYKALYEAGKLKIYTIRDKENRLIGYNLFYLSYHTYHKALPMALQDVTYVSPSARGFTSIKFIKWCDEQLINLKVKLILYHVKPKRDFGPLLKRMGYSLADNVYVKYILES